MNSKHLLQLLMIIIACVTLGMCMIHYNINLGNEGFEVNETSDVKEPFCTNPCLTENTTHCLIPANPPESQPQYFKVGNEEADKEVPMVPSEGKYMFKKPELLYDGIWRSEPNRIGCYEKNNWRLAGDGCSAGTYGANKYFDIKNKPIDGMKAPVDGCAELSKKSRQAQEPNTICKYYPEPDMEDILGYRKA